MTHEEIARVHKFTNAMLDVRDRLIPILKGEIERGHCLPGKSTAYLDKPGFRKTKLKDAVEIARHIHAIINRAVNEIERPDEGDDCEYGVACGDWCEACNKAYKSAIAEDQ